MAHLAQLYSHYPGKQSAAEQYYSEAKDIIRAASGSESK